VTTRQPRPRTAGALAARLVAAITVVVLGLLAGSRPAAAHAELISTTPAAGDQLAASPEAVTLVFTEAVELPEISLLDAQGSPLPIGAPTQATPSVASATLPVLADGGYVVAWNAVSADGHPIDGAFTFAVGNGPLPDVGVGTGAGAPGGWNVALSAARALQYAGVALSLGLWAFVVLCWWAGRGARRVVDLAVGGAAVLALASVARIAFQAEYLDSSISDVLRTETGRSWMTAAVLALPIGLLPTSLARLLTRRVHGVALVVLAVLVGRAIAIGGHGATGRAAAFGNALTIVHVGAAALWVGGIVGVLVCLRRRPARTADMVSAEPVSAGAVDTETVDTETVDGTEQVVRRFSNVALIAVGVLATSGILQAVRRLETLDALTGSSYGETLIVKVAAIAVLLAVAALSRFVLRSGELVMHAAGSEERRWSWPRVLRRTVTIEAVLAAAVIGITGTLAGASPLVDTSSDPINLAIIEGDRTAYISVFPARSGTNSVHITIDEPSIQGPDEITVELAPADGRIAPIDVPVVDAGPGHVIADAAAIPFPGSWSITVNARYGEFELVSFTAGFSVG
jgi:copper transport protein